LSAQHRDLISQYEDLGVVGRLAAGEQAELADELTDDQIEELNAMVGVVQDAQRDRTAVLAAERARSRAAGADGPHRSWPRRQAPMPPG
jgi:hypothetical protein